MKRDQFVTALDAFFQGPRPYRHLYVWRGEANDLMLLLPSDRVQRLDMFRLAADLSHHPLAQVEANQLLRDALHERLRHWYTSDAESRPVLVLTGCELLARYEVSLQPFYQVLTYESMVILVCSAADSSYDPAERLPAYVHCEPGTTLSYLSRLVEDDHVIETS